MLSAQLTNMGESAAYVAHEVNQPLAAIVISAEIALEWLQRDPPNLALARQAIERVIGSSHRAAIVARSARDQVRRCPIVVVDIDINGVIEFALELRALDLSRLDIVVQTDLAHDLPPLSGDRVQLERLVCNLIANALDAMKDVEGRPRELRISSVVGEAGEVRVEIEDSGSGIDPAHRDHIFDPFFTTKPEGTGLGLSICRSIVESHGGRLSATPNSSHGSTFTFTLATRQR